jgi:Alpha/beta hydrolase domain
LTCLALIGVSVLALAPPAGARVTKIEITATESPTYGGRSFGTVGTYERLTGRVTGAIDPKDPLNAIIVDIGLAPKNAQGLVTYSTDFQILRPIDRSKGNHRLLYEITNRGRTIAFGDLNDSKMPNDLTTAGDAGTGFLMNRGFVLLTSGWDPTVGAGGGKTFRTTVPLAKNPDGSSITGPVFDELAVDKNATPERFVLSYAAASADKSRATLTVRKNYADTPVEVPAAEWDYVDANLKAIKLTSGNFGAAGSFGPTALYEFAYIGKDPIVAGLGLAVIRDLAAFLRDAKADDAGTPNPLAGDIQYTYTTCSSQPCRTMNDFVLLGFNQVEGKSGDTPRRAIDGVLNWKAGGSGLFINYRFAQPVRTHRQHIGRWSPEFQFPFADVTLTDPITEKTGGRLARCQASNTCPMTACRT